MLHFSLNFVYSFHSIQYVSNFSFFLICILLYNCTFFIFFCFILFIIHRIYGFSYHIRWMVLLSFVFCDKYSLSGYHYRPFISTKKDKTIPKQNCEFLKIKLIVWLANGQLDEKKNFEEYLRRQNNNNHLCKKKNINREPVRWRNFVIECNKMTIFERFHQTAMNMNSSKFWKYFWVLQYMNTSYSIECRILSATQTPIEAFFIIVDNFK